MWQSCCKWHHDSVKQVLEGMYLRGRIPLADLWLTSATARELTIGLAADGEGVGQSLPPSAF